MTEQELIARHDKNVQELSMKNIPQVKIAPIQYTGKVLSPIDMDFLNQLQTAANKKAEALPEYQMPEGSQGGSSAVGEGSSLGGLSDKIIKYAKEYGATEQQTAYMLATAKHESNFENIAEKSADDNYFQKYVGKLGNKDLSDAVKYKGRGVVQITGKSNYEKFGKLFGVDLVNDPDLILKDNDLAAKILVKGSLDGFTGSKGIGAFSNYKDMRQAINGDIAKNGDKIAGYATNYEQLLKKGTTPISQGATKTLGDSGYDLNGLALKFLATATDAKGGYVDGRISPALFNRDWIEGGATQSSAYALRTKPSGTKDYNIAANGLQMNLGTDLVPKKGAGARVLNQTDVKGEVIYSGDKGSYGNQVAVKYTFPDGKSVYQEFNHLQSTNVKVGDILARGQEIGKVGRTGNVTGVHLDAPSYIMSGGKRVYQNPEGGNAFNIANTAPQPALKPISQAFNLTGNSVVDERVKMLAEKRGYQPQASYTGNLVSVGNQKVSPEIATAYSKLEALAKRDGKPLSLVSGYRDTGSQKNLFLGDYNKKKFTPEQVRGGLADAHIDSILATSSIPGYSRHHTGRTIDIGAGNSDLLGFKNTDTYKWISANDFKIAKEAGLMPSYPAGGKNMGPNPEEWEFVLK